MAGPPQYGVGLLGLGTVGSQVAERLERKWTSIEINADYVTGSALRFDGAAAA